MHGKKKKVNVDQICPWSAETRVGNNNGIEGGDISSANHNFVKIRANYGKKVV